MSFAILRPIFIFGNCVDKRSKDNMNRNLIRYFSYRFNIFIVVNSYYLISLNWYQTSFKSRY